MLHCARRLRTGLAVLALVAVVPGCGLFVAAGKMFWGDPVLPSMFTHQTGVRLHKIEGEVLVFCTAPEAIKEDMASIELDLAEMAGRAMQQRGVRVVSSREVAGYLEDSGGIWGDPDDMVDHFPDAKVIIKFELGRFEYKDPRSPTVLQGKVRGMLTAYEIQDVDGLRTTRQVFQQEFNSKYPQHEPIFAADVSERIFQQRLTTRIGTQLAQVFVDYRASQIVH